ncbi:GNAT family N-acetyltransferase [Halalkalicoccus sp. NIPERK01]|uniref:lipid II:glycine glycyltransferase FemX n=1 Tax=Halalkalicoccus sp. NIPERK01 TaxID=3053469 RepID=UPI00256EFFA6|nr:GNAT family N-acetyltransferase [Halalkalicoccus sp. NIPERK01]MDL5360586.1 GNAT family N-acetyltransferase [Halalkalicoccus sp. NIPERK01]
MSIEIREASDPAEWNGYVERSPQGTVFHRAECVSVLADHADGRAHLLVGYKGQEPVGVFPVTAISRARITTAFSPPPGFLIPYLGPALLSNGSLKQRKAEKRHHRFVEGCLEWIEGRYAPKYTHVRTACGYADVRPLAWNGFDVTPQHTYAVELGDDEEGLLMRFSSDARSNVRNAEDDDYEIDLGGRGAIERIVDQLERRYGEQDESYLLDAGFVTDLYDRLGPDHVKPYVCRVGGEFVGGMIALADDERVYRWQGGAKSTGGLPVNDLLDWRIMREAIDAGRREYDLVGADTERLNGYKAKFNPALRTYYSTERGSRPMRMVAGIYKQFR